LRTTAIDSHDIHSLLLHQEAEAATIVPAAAVESAWFAIAAAAERRRTAVAAGVVEFEWNPSNLVQQERAVAQVEDQQELLKNTPPDQLVDADVMVGSRCLN
jgi:hypothetical protein